MLLPVLTHALDPARLADVNSKTTLPGTIEGEGKRCPECSAIRPNNTPEACKSCDAAWQRSLASLGKTSDLDLRIFYAFRAHLNASKSFSPQSTNSDTRQPTQAQIEADVAAMVEMAKNTKFVEPQEAAPKGLTGYELFRAALATLTGATRGQQLSLRRALARPSKHAKRWKSSRSLGRKRTSCHAMEHATRKANR